VTGAVQQLHDALASSAWTIDCLAFALSISGSDRAQFSDNTGLSAFAFRLSAEHKMDRHIAPIVEMPNSAYSEQISQVSTFVCLPKEIHQNIIDCLRYPDLQRLRGTCKKLRYLPSDLHVLNSLEMMDEDVGHKVCREAPHKDIVASAFDREDLTEHLKRCIKCLALVTLGYTASDFYFCSRLSICEGCRNLVGQKHFCDTHNSQNFAVVIGQENFTRGLGISAQYPGRPDPDPFRGRPVCKDCFWSAKGFAAGHLRWSRSVWTGQWVIRCAGRGQGKKYVRFAKPLQDTMQEHLGLCAECNGELSTAGLLVKGWPKRKNQTWESRWYQQVD
jgi:hypothetical protein